MTVLCSEGSTTTRVPSFPTFVINGKGKRRGIDWGFNTWGGEVDGLYPRGRTTTAWHASSATCLAMTFTASVILSARAARSTPTARTTPQYALSSRDRTLYVGRLEELAFNWAADSRTGAQGRTSARNNALWTVLAVLMMESINEEKTSLYTRKRGSPMTAFTVKYYIYTIGTADFLHAFFLHCLRTAGK